MFPDFPSCIQGLSTLSVFVFWQEWLHICWAPRHEWAFNHGASCIKIGGVGSTEAWGGACYNNIQINYTEGWRIGFTKLMS